MAKRKTKPATDSRLFVLALGLLVGFVVAFVFLLSRLPVDGIIQANSGTQMQGAEMSEMNFDYYAVLQEQKASRKPEPSPAVAVEPPVVFMEPPREILPDNLAPQGAQGNDSSSVQQQRQEPVPVQPDLQQAQTQTQAQAQAQAPVVVSGAGVVTGSSTTATSGCSGSAGGAGASVTSSTTSTVSATPPSLTIASKPSSIFDEDLNIRSLSFLKNDMRRGP